MLITNGVVTRNISAKQFAEYEARGYRKIDTPAKAETPKPKKAAKPKAGDK